jgi:predicted acylesterase/phospholipase RssA
MTSDTASSWAQWGSLAARYQEPRPRRMLALDGGGIRGVITLEVLCRLEELLRVRYGRGDLRLSDYFDYIGGTSTGAIIAAALAIGMSAQDVQKFYLDFGLEVFRKRPLLERLRSLYENGPLEKKLREVYGEARTLEPQHLKTLLLVVTRNSTTDSPWPVSSNPAAKYNHPGRKDCNLRIPLWRLVRASTAAPVYFSPEVIAWDPERPSDPNSAFVFVDGGTTSYNCPAFLMYRMATEPAYRLGWQRGEQSLLVVSVGTGSAPAFGNEADNPDSSILASVPQTLKALMGSAQVDQDINCRTIGRCTYGDEIDREVEDLIARDGGDIVKLDQDRGRSFLYARYDAELTFSGLSRLKLGGQIDPARVNRLDAVDAMDDLRTVGRALAQKVDLEHFGAFADPDSRQGAGVRAWGRDHG